MTLLWWLNTIVWAIVAAIMAPAAIRAATPTCRGDDPWRLMAFGCALMMGGFSLRWIVAADNIVLWKLLYVLSAGLAVYIIVIARILGRVRR